MKKFNYLFFLFILAVTMVSCSEKDVFDEASPSTRAAAYAANIQRYEAEQASLTNDANIEYSLANYSGSGYVNLKGGDVIFKVNAPAKGKYNLYLRYLNSNDRKENDLYVNGGRYGAVSFEPASAWTTIFPNIVDLNGGENTITIKNTWGWVFIDYIELEAAQDLQFNVSANLVTKNPSPQATKLYNYLKENFGQKVISGTMANYSSGLEEANWVHDQTGKWPALTGFDLINYTRDWSWTNYTELVDNCKLWANNNGIVSVMWHWRDPSWVTDGFYSQDTSFDVTKVYDSNSSEYKAMISDIDKIAQYLKQLKDANIPVVWRPLHEASGQWFWWGSKGPEAYKYLWKVMFDRLINYHGLNNLIWVWTSETHDNEVDWYPGDEYVDIVGIDIYPGENQHGSQSIVFEKLKNFYKGRKILSLSECGSVPDPDAMFTSGDTWSWYMVWNDYFTRSDSHNGAAYWRKMFNNSRVITRDQLPNLK